MTRGYVKAALRRSNVKRRRGQLLAESAQRRRVKAARATVRELLKYSEAEVVDVYHGDPRFSKALRTIARGGKP